MTTKPDTTGQLREALAEADLDMLEIAEGVATSMFPPSKTYPEGPSIEDIANMTILKEAVYGILEGENVLFLARPGRGKTSFIKALGPALEPVLRKQLGLEVTVPVTSWHMPTRTPEDNVLVLRAREDNGESHLKAILHSDLTIGLRNPLALHVLHMDESRRATKAVRNQGLELIQKRTLSDETTGVHTILASDNLDVTDGIAGQPDPAFADRFNTVVLTDRDLPWQYAIAAKFANDDLTEVFKVWWQLKPEVREQFSPRILEHVLTCLSLGLPARLGLPIITKRMALMDGTEDVTETTLNAIAAAFGRPNPSKMGEVTNVIRLAITNGLNLFIQGPPGCGKTAITEAVAKEMGADTLTLSMSCISPDRMSLIMSDGDGIGTETIEWMVKAASSDAGKVLVLDEIHRAPSAVKHQTMEITQERTIGGTDIRDLRCVIGLNNPKEVAGYRMDVGVPDRAQASRFVISIEVGPEDMPWDRYLAATYGDLAEPFLQWWREHLDAKARVLITARTLERMIKRYKRGLPLENAKAYLDGEFAPVSLHELQALLKDRPIVKFKALVREVDSYVARMSAPNGDKDPVQWDVFDALWTADLRDLEADRDVCVRLNAWMSKQNKLNLIRNASNDETSKFWQSVVQDGAKLKKAALEAAS